MLNEEMGMQLTLCTEERVEGFMPISPRWYQPHGFLHGGATLSFLESLASAGTAAHCGDFSELLPFGVECSIRHRKSGKEGLLTGVATLDRTEGNKLYWNVAAYDDAGDVVSDGWFMTKIVSRARLAEIERERELGLR